MSVEITKPWTIVHGFWPETQNFDSIKKSIIIVGKGITRGTEWCKFRLHSIFQQGIVSVEAKSIENVTIVHYQ